VIKILFCLRRLPGLSRDEFQRYWRNQHAPLVRECAPALNIRRYVQNYGFLDSRLSPAIDVRGSPAEVYDGVAEVWWDDLEQAVSAGATREGRAAGRRLVEDERRFIDLANSPLIYAREVVILPD
jgi:uncharacterized protein (TIGR02118 family)